MLPYIAIGMLQPANAYDLDNAIKIIGDAELSDWQREQLRIREYRLQQWQAQHPQTQPTQRQNKHTAIYQQEPSTEDLFNAAKSGNVAKIAALLGQGLDINVSNQQRETALHMAAARGQFSTVIYLVKHGAYVNAPTVKNWQPLHHAVRFGHPNIVNYLMQHHAKPYAQTSDGLSAVDMARNAKDYRILALLGAR